MVSGTRKKAQEISFVLLRIAPYIQRKELRSRLESLGYQLIEEVYSGNTAGALSKIDAITGLVALASNVLDINKGNADILSKELGILNTAIRQDGESWDMPDFEKSFSRIELPHSEVIRQKIKNSTIGLIDKSKKSDNPAKVEQLKSNDAVLPPTTPLKETVTEDIQDVGKANARQDDILYKIRQLPEQRAQLKDIIAAFPGISERTLRYDLGKLCDNGRLTREGAGGPSNFYVIKV